MTKPVTRKMAVDCLLDRIIMQFGTPLIAASTGEELLPGMDIEFDHVHADVHGGPHDYKNLRPLPKKTHRAKTTRDIQANAKVKRILNPKPSKRPMKSSGRKMQSRPFPKPFVPTLTRTP